jgi:hypothetical protein
MTTVLPSELVMLFFFFYLFLGLLFLSVLKVSIDTVYVLVHTISIPSKSNKSSLIIAIYKRVIVFKLN